jgi:hypothetical protein
VTNGKGFGASGLWFLRLDAMLTRRPTSGALVVLLALSVSS